MFITELYPHMPHCHTPATATCKVNAQPVQTLFGINLIYAQVLY